MTTPSLSETVAAPREETCFFASYCGDDHVGVRRSKALSDTFGMSNVFRVLLDGSSYVRLHLVGRADLRKCINNNALGKGAGSSAPLKLLRYYLIRPHKFSQARP
jgi:hypothetical protein